MQTNPPVFITGGTGYLGHALITELLTRGNRVIALARPGSAHKLPAGAASVLGNALDAASYAAQVPHGATFVHLIGVAHPAPAKTAQFESIDLASVVAALAAAREAQAAHFIYVSVAQPAPVMRAYQDVRARAEALIRASGIPATIVRPWYVLGPGHRWPYLLLPFYWLAECVPVWRASARRLRMVTLAQMVSTLAAAVAQPATGVRVIEADEIVRTL
ncbi:MAG: NAD-dependent epimerase/dehydratase family protein [Burkholderiaceae bacterium]|nr:MAG: NAD-dependent epimerase/dehydratase family protein [Burkholderiaceae bacterium]